MLCSCAVVILKWLRMKVVDSAPHASICVHPLSFTSIVEAIRLGRRIFDNLHKAMSFVFAVHVHVPDSRIGVDPRPAEVAIGADAGTRSVSGVDHRSACSLAFEAEPEESGLISGAPAVRTSLCCLNAAWPSAFSKDLA